MHYYCPACGSFELADTSLFSFDLPNKKCPNCGATIYADGYNLSSESVWGPDGKKAISFDYDIPADFLPFAKRILESIYSDQSIAPYGLLKHKSDSSIPYMVHTGFIILPENQSMLCELTAVNHNTYASVRKLASDILNNELPGWLDSEVYSKCTCATREDFFDLLIHIGYSREDAFTISELICKGKAHSQPELFEEYNLPSDVMEAAKNCLYLFPRAHIIEYMFMYYRLAYYVNCDSKSYRKITQKAN